MGKGGHLQPFPKPQPSRLIYMQLFTCAVNSNYVYRCLLNIYGKGTSAWLKYPYKGLDQSFFFFFSFYHHQFNYILRIYEKKNKFQLSSLIEGLTSNAYIWLYDHFRVVLTVNFFFFILTQEFH